MSTLFTTQEAYGLALSLRSYGAKLLAGGPHATLLPDEPLDYGFDAVVVGEGEPTILEAIQAVLGKVPLDRVKGLVYCLPDGQVCNTTSFGRRLPISIHFRSRLSTW